MPLLYGEGPRAFLRLQEEIIKITGDLSILAWQHHFDNFGSDLLAREPSDFRNCRDIIPTSSSQYGFDNIGLMLTAQGLQIQKPMILGLGEHNGNPFQFALSLGCRHSNKIREILALKLRHVATSKIAAAGSLETESTEDEKICQLDFAGLRNPESNRDCVVSTDFLSFQRLPEFSNMMISRVPMHEKVRQRREGRERWNHLWIRLSENLSPRWRAFRVTPEGVFWDLENLTMELDGSDRTWIRVGLDPQTPQSRAPIYEKLTYGAVALSDNLDSGITVACLIRDRYLGEEFISSSLFWKIAPYDVDNFTNMAHELEGHQYQRSMELPVAGSRVMSATFESVSRWGAYIALLRMDFALNTIP